MSRNIRKCTICNKNEYKTYKAKLFFAAFPLNEYRCREWIRIVGNPELVFLPIEKLHTRKFVCGDHFHKKYFNKKGNRLKKKAIPTLNLSSVPLTDDQLKEFPQHMWNYKEGDDKSPMHCFPDPNKDPERFRSWVHNIGGEILNLDEKYVYKCRRVCHKHFDTPYHTWTCTLTANAIPTLLLSGSQRKETVQSDRILESVSGQEPTSPQHEDLKALVPEEQPSPNFEDSAVDTFEDDEPAEVSVEDAVEGPFSWQQSNAVVPCDADILDQEEGTPFFADDQSKAVNEEARQTDTTVYHCNECEQEILGYRYICVQCSDYDLCSRCEGKGLHFLHYVLRVPACKRQVEVEAVLAAVRRAINSMHLIHDEEMEIKEEKEVLLDEGNPEPPLERDPFAEDVTDAGVCDTVSEDSDPVPDETHLERNLGRSCRQVYEKSGKANPKKEKRTEISLHNLGISQSDQATATCDSSISQNKKVDTTKKVVLKIVPKSFVSQRNVSAPNNKVLLKVVKTKPKGNILATEGTMHTTESGVLPAKSTVLVTGKTMPARGKNIPFIVRKNQTSERTLPTVVRAVPTTERTLPTVVRSVPSSEITLPTVVRIIPTTERTLPTVVRSVPTSERTLPTVVRSVSSSEITLPTVVRIIPTTERTLPTGVRSVPTSERTLPTVVRSVPNSEIRLTTESSTKDSVCSNQKIVHLSIETGTTTVTKSLNVSMSNLEHSDADALSEPVRKKFKGQIQGASSSSETSTESVPELAREAIVRVQRLKQEEINSLHKS